MAAPAIAKKELQTLEDVQNYPAATLTRSQVSQILNVDPRTITAAIKAGEIPAIKVGRRVLIPRLPFLEMLTTTEKATDREKA